MLISVTIVICTSFIVSTLFFLSKKNTLMEEEKEKESNTNENPENTYKYKIAESITKHYLFLMPLFALVLTLLIFWGYETFNWLIKL